MATDKRTSTLIEQQFPDFVRQEGPKMVSFLKGYYEWMEQTGNLTDTSKNILSYHDLDTTTDKYLEFLRRELIPTIPRNALIDKAHLMKHVINLYRSKGSENSYKFLFRAIYDEDIDFYYPGNDILRASGGIWSKESSVRVSSPKTGNLSSLGGQIITGLMSGASGRVERIVSTRELGLTVTELFLSGISGTFQEGERVRNAANSINATIVTAIGPIASVDIDNQGSLHQVGDRVSITALTGRNANGEITATTDQGPIQLSIIDGGSGYRLSSPIDIIGGSGTGASFAVGSISNTETLANFCTDIINPMRNVVLNTGPLFVSAGANTSAVSANLALANVSSVLQSTTGLNFGNVTIGKISSITTVSHGTDYTTLPTIDVNDTEISQLGISDGSGGVKGHNAVIVANNIYGAIVSVRILNAGTSYSRNELATLSNLSRSGTNNATATVNPQGVVEYSGKYLDTKGWLSWNNVLQDNYYYQEYSYDIQTNIFLKKYKKIVSELIHPAGTKLFGTYSVNSIITLSTTTVSSNVVLTVSTGNGNITILSNSQINPYASNTVAAIYSVQIQEIGTAKLVWGKNQTTIFQSELVNGDTITIVNDDAGVANGTYLTNVVHTNTALTLTTAYANTFLANGTFIAPFA